MNAHRKGIQLSAEEQVEIFGTTASARSTPRGRGPGRRKPNDTG